MVITCIYVVYFIVFWNLICPFDAKNTNGMLNCVVYILPMASSDDFEQSLQTVTFSARQSTKTVYIKINDDNRVENTEAFQVEILLSYSEYSRGVRFGSPSKVKVYIKDGMQV